VLWFDKDRFETFVWWMALLAVLNSVSTPRASASLVVERLLLVYPKVQKLLKAEAQSDYQIARLLEAL
jgi:hypothetical protein